MKLSVIIPTFNCARFVSRAINSVLGQKWHDLEIIVVDDGSIDDTVQVVQQFGSSKLRYIRQSNLGPAAARNRGIRESQAEWIAFLDARVVIIGGVQHQHLVQHRLMPRETASTIT